VGGDIGTAADVSERLLDLADMAGMTVHFVLGNHDYYGGSIAQVRQRVGSLGHSGLRWLPAAGPQELAPGVTLVVHTQAAKYGQPDFVLVKIHSGAVEISEER